MKWLQQEIPKGLFLSVIVTLITIIVALAVFLSK